MPTYDLIRELPLTIDDVSDKLKMPHRVVEAMEAEDWKKVTDRYFSKEDQEHWAERMKDAGPQDFDQAEYSRKWKDLGSRVEAAIPKGPDSAEAQGLYDEWQELLAPFKAVASPEMMQGDFRNLVDGQGRQIALYDPFTRLFGIDGLRMTLLDQAARGGRGDSAAALAGDLVPLPSPPREQRLRRIELDVGAREEHPAKLIVRERAFHRGIVLRLVRVDDDRLVGLGEIGRHQEVRLVHDDRTADGEAVLVLAKGGLRRPGRVVRLLFEQVHRVERLVAKELERLTAEEIGTAFGDDGDDAAGGAAKLGRRLTDVDAELADSTLREVLPRVSARALLIRHPVHEKRVLTHRATSPHADADPPRH